MEILFSGIFVTLIGALIAFIDKWKKRTDPDHKKANSIAILSLILAFVGGSIAFTSGRQSLHDKAKSDSISLKKDIENRIANDSIKILNRQLQSLAIKQLDTSRTILKYSEELTDTYKENSKLQAEVNKYLIGDKTVPWVTTMADFRNITFTILNTSKYPMRNVKVKCQETQLLNIGDLAPRVVNRFYTITIPKEFKEETFNFVIWYNNGQSILVDISMKRRPDNFLEQTKVSYYNRDGVEFEHPLIKHKPANFWNYKTPGYKPDETF